MSGEPSTTSAAVVSCALEIASATRLDARLDAVARHASQIACGPAAVLLLDDVLALRPAAAHGPELRDLPVLDASDASSSSDPAARAVMDRREILAARGREAAVLEAVPSARLAVHFPMLTERDDGTADVEGVLVAAIPSDRPDPDIDALRALAVLGALVTSRARLETALEERSDWLDRLAHTDALTRLANRRTLDRVLELEIARAARQATTLGVAIFGVDGLDGLAEREGAHAADDVLRRVAASLADTVRLVDTVARYGRSEFVVVAPGSSGLAMAQRAAGAIARIGENGAPPALSVGVAIYPADGSAPGEMLASAERALADARQRGGAIVSAT